MDGNSTHLDHCSESMHLANTFFAGESSQGKRVNLTREKGESGERKWVTFLELSNLASGAAWAATMRGRRRRATLIIFKG